ncbi:MAG: aspartate-semialdehyde dehydrogenase [Candidatus Altiarchaeota archaeon]
MDKLNVGILGATGMVGQRFIEGLVDHPYFEIKALAASERSEGKRYKDAAKWYLSGEIPADIASAEVVDMSESIVEKYDLDIIFSAIPAEIAEKVEGSFAKKIPLFSNTKTYRMEDDVPLIIPEVNPEHLSLLEVQKKRRKWEGFIITNPNCSTVGLVVPLKPIMDKYGLKWVNVATMQALSGAGYNGVPSMAILDNMIPFIGGEEPKVETETLKILGKFGNSKVDYAKFAVFASCNRIATLNGHMEAAFIGTEKDCSEDDIKKALSGFKGEPQKLKLPSAPNPVIIVREEDDRPQPRLDRDAGKGMAVTCGRIRKKMENVFKFTCLSHNTIRGAAGASILNAELVYKKGLI